MSLPKKVINFLGKSKVKYEIIEHRKVFTAFDKSKTLKVKPAIIGKTLILKVNGDLVVVLISGSKNLDKTKFKKIVNHWRKGRDKKAIKKINFVSERLIKNKFKGVKVGATPPFGNLFNLPTFVDSSLLKESEIIVSSGIYTQSIKIRGSFLLKLVPDLIKGRFTKSKK
jgi:Ala-tRNA(Pro) deacylase